MKIALVRDGVIVEQFTDRDHAERTLEKFPADGDLLDVVDEVPSLEAGEALTGPDLVMESGRIVRRYGKHRPPPKAKVADAAPDLTLALLADLKRQVDALAAENAQMKTEMAVTAQMAVLEALKVSPTGA